MIDKFQLDKSNTVFQNYEFKSNQNNTESSFNKINIFVGANNSGKSRFLRELFKQYRKKELNGNFDKIDFRYIKIDEALKIFDPIFESYLETDTENSNTKKDTEYINNHKKRFKKPNHYCPVERKVSEEITDRSSSKFEGYLSFKEYSEIIYELNLGKGGASEIVTPHNYLFSEITDNEKKKLNEFCYSTYIPILRTLKKVSIEENLFKERIYSDYFHDFPDITKTNIFTGEDLFSIISRVTHSVDRAERQNLKDFENFIKKNFLNDNFEILALDNTGENEKGELIKNEYEDLSILIGGEERRIPFLGDGIQSLIILTFPLFMHKNRNHVLFIDEPELNLHPGLQRLFFQILNYDDFKNTQVFISTHSNHLLNISTDYNENISVFSFDKKLDNNRVQIEDISQRASEALDLLGICNSSVFLANCTIWIEGISDRIHLKKYLDLYCKEHNKNKFIEDYHFAFIEYGGINIKHWSFFESDNGTDKMSFEAISNKVFLLVDNDDKEEYHVKMKERLCGVYNYLNCLEIENLITPEILKKTLFEYRAKKADVNYDSFNISLKDIKYELYEKMPIGNLIQDLISNDNQMTKGFIWEVSKGKYAIRDKRKFNEFAMKNTKEWTDLSEEAQKLAEKIYKFIESNNK